MKPTKTLISTTSMLAILISAVVIAGCQKDGSLNNSNSDLISADRYYGNKSPVARAGVDQAITLPVDSVNFDGSGSYDPDGTISSYAWTKEAGTGGTISSPNTAKTSLTGLSSGDYRFRLTIKDNKGATASDTVHVSVKGTGGTTTTPPPTDQPPVVNAGAAQTITLPVSSATLSGTATDPDGTIASYLWTKVSGNAAVIASPAIVSTLVTGLTAGSYVFNLKATDNGGASANKSVTITVNAATTTTPPPGGGTTGTLAYSNGFNSSSDINSNQLGRGIISTSVYNIGPGSFKSIVDAGDGQISGGWRSEQQYGETLSPNNTPIAVEYDELFETLPNVGGLSVQWHGNTTGTSGQMAMWITSGKFEVVRNIIGTAGSSLIHQSGTLMSIQTNRWYHFRWEIKFTSGTDGYVRCYIDNNLYYSATGQTSDGSGQYLKAGQNLFSSPSVNSTMYIDNLKCYVN